MKRWIALLGRGGTILIAISLALLLVSLIPSARTVPIVNTTELAPDTFTPLRTFPPPLESFFERRLTPQQELEMEFTTNGTVTVYVLETDVQSILNWISEQKQIFARDFNHTRLEEFLEAHPGSIGWESEIHDEIEYTYVPKTVTNATIILANPSSDTVNVLYHVTTTNIIAPADKVRTIALVTTPLGLILAIPWLANIWKERKQS